MADNTDHKDRTESELGSTAVSNVMIEADPFAGPGWDGHAKGPVDGVAVPRRRVKKSRRRRRRRRIGATMVIVGGVITLAGVWLAITGQLARDQLNQVREQVHVLRTAISAGDLPAARNAAIELAEHAHRAHTLTSGPVWSVAAGVPGAGAPLVTIRGLTSSIDLIGSDALPELVDATTQLDPSMLRNADGSINLGPIADLSPALSRASAAMTAATTAIAGLPKRTWLGTIDSARSDVLAQLTSLSHSVRSAELAVRIAPPMLGHDGPKSYLVSFQNQAELRGTGGLPGAFAIVKADRGKLTFTRFESDSVLTTTPSGLDLGPAFNQLYKGSNATEEYADSNSSPNFPYAAQIWVAMWQKLTGQRLDGAIALDPTALSYLLQVAGPATLPDKSPVTAANVVDLTQRTLYTKFATEPMRKAYLLDIARAVSTHLIATEGGDTADLVRAAGRATGERRLLAWSTDPAVEADLVQTALGGAVPTTTEPFVGMAINNSSANKVDYYLNASVSWKRSGCGPTRNVKVTITVKNSAPTGLPPYVLGQTGRPGFPQNPGDDRVLVGYYATQGAALTKVSLDGFASTSAIGSELGHPVYTTNLLVPRGHTRQIVLDLTEPAGSLPPRVMSQPMVQPMAVAISDQACG